jgi:hypothetical protein
MSKRITTSEQYGDQRGRIGIDGWDGLATIQVAGCPKGYWPVGLSLYAEPMSKGDPLVFSATVLMVDESILEQKGPDGVRKYAHKYGEVPVFQHDAKISMEKILPMIKRVSIVLQDKCTNDAPLIRAGADTIYE